MKLNKNKGLVYSSEFGEICHSCGNPVKKCICIKSISRLPEDGIVRIGRQTKGRKGAGVSIIIGLSLNENELKDLARQLKQKCGTGGTVKSGNIEIQGNHRELLKQELTKLGYTVKLAGG
ncbi:MAG: translation initiation factor Sui1 [Spirochaetes bacterium]|nr:translation initiation factor Sui1 [Spirochaetota bacterium]